MTSWARTICIETALTQQERDRIVEMLDDPRVCIRFGESGESTYALLEAPESAQPAMLQAKLPQARWYDEVIIALAIEPTPKDALPLLLDALGGAGRPAGVILARIDGNRIVVESHPSVTPVHFVLRIADVELRRFHGSRRTQLLTPLPMAAMVQLAAQGLQAPDITAERVLEILLEEANVV